MEKKYVVRYQGGSGGFLVAWLLQMTVQSDCFDSALQCFHHSLKNNPIQWKNYEIVPPDIAFHSTTTRKLKLNAQLRSLIEKIINNDTSISHNSLIIKQDFFSYVYTYHTKNFHENNCFQDMSRVANFIDYDSHLIEKMKEHVKLLYTLEKNIFVTAPITFIKLANRTKAFSYAEYDDSSDFTFFCRHDFDNNYYNVTDTEMSIDTYFEILNEYQDKIKLFPIESIWHGDWNEHLEKCIGKKITPHQEHRCRTIISRWLEIQPEEIKKGFNL